MKDPRDPTAEYVQLDGEGDLRMGRGCMRCAHLQSVMERRCKAYPKPYSIPLPIWRDEVNHRKPYKDDNGIQFQERPTSQS